MKAVRSVAVSRKMILLMALLASVGVAGCGGARGEAGSEETGGQGGGETLTIFAAASLTDAFGELATEFERRNQGVEVRISFAGSSTLATQIVQGAPAGVFASADGDQMRKVVDEGFVAGEPRAFVGNREVVVVPEENPGDIRDFGDLSEPGLRLVLAQEEVPAAEYAERILANAAGDPEYGPRFERAVMDNLVSREEDVRAAINRVVTGDADATFGYASDVTPEIRDEVRVIEIPENLNIVATYPIATLERAENPELARRWVEFVLSEEGQNGLEEWGFKPVSGRSPQESTAP